MATILSSNLTPSKKVRSSFGGPPFCLMRCVQAAAALESFSIDSPLKNFVKVIDDERLPESPKSITEDEQVHDKLGELREKFVGEVNLPESTSYCHIFFWIHSDEWS